MTDTVESNYIKFRGKCRQMSEALVQQDPSLRLVRGHYWCPIWNRKEPHWWCVKADGTIVDPTRLQFPSEGMGTYEEFNGVLHCAECGQAITEEEADIDGNYAFCSYTCHGRFVGVL